MLRASVLVLYALAGTPVLKSGALPPYTITTFAGSSNNGDGGPAAQAFISVLEGVCTDSAGNVYIADAGDNRIRKIDLSGIITTYAGANGGGYAGDGGPAVQALLQSPYGIRMDSSGTLYVADLGNGRIRAITPDGNISTLASGLMSPRNLAFDAGGSLYVSEFGGQRVSRVSSDGSLTVVAGNGTAGYAGDGSAAVTAELNGPAGIAFDGSGNLYIADSGNAVIRRVDANGVISTEAGIEGTGTIATLTLNVPTGVAADGKGDVYVVNRDYPRTFRISSTGAVTMLPGVGRDIAVGPSGSVFIVADQHLQEVSWAGTLTTVMGPASFTFGDGGPANSARFESVASVAADGSGDVVVADAAFRRLREILPDGNIETLPASDSITLPEALAFTPGGQLVMGDAGKVETVDAGGQPNVIATYPSPAGIAVDTNGDVFFTSGNEVYKTTAAKTAAVPAQGLNQPTALALGADGTLYIADTGNNRVAALPVHGGLINVAGSAAGFAGDSGPASQALLNQPSGLCVDGSGNLWIADTGNNRIRVVDSGGTIQTVAGTGVSWLSGDGGPAIEATLSDPTALACDKAGNVYIADSGNRRVRKLSVGAASNESAPPAAVTVVHAATFKPGPIAGGEIVSLFGQNIGPATAVAGQLDRSGKIASILSGTEVFFNGVAAPLYYVSENQLNVEAPVEIAGSVSALVTVQQGATIVAGTVVDVAAAEPGLFGGSGSAAALNQDLSVNSAGNPAKPGSVIVLYGTGFGETNPPEITGQPAAVPLGVPLAFVTVTIDNSPAAVLYAGDAFGFAGLTQINATIPGNVHGQVAVSVAAGGMTSPIALSIWVE